MIKQCFYYEYESKTVAKSQVLGQKRQVPDFHQKVIYWDFISTLQSENENFYNELHFQAKINQSV